MYRALWRALPGPGWLRVIFLLILFVATVYLLFEYVFPWAEPYLPLNENTITDDG